jgi:hypothetical protein
MLKAPCSFFGLDWLSSPPARLVRAFLGSAAALLCATAIAKIVSAFGNAKLLDLPDPILLLSHRHVFLLVGFLEFGVAMFCLASAAVTPRAVAVAWLSSVFMAYRLGLRFLVGNHTVCPCLGTLTEALHVSPRTADTAMQIVLWYLLLGSCSVLLRIWKTDPAPVTGMASSLGDHAKIQG